MRLKTWLLHGNHIFLNGSAGWGKGVVLKTALRDANVRCVVTVQCTSLTSSQVLVAKLSQNCLSIPTAKGRIMRPKNADRLVLFVKDIHVIRKDRWGHRQVEAFLRQVKIF
jgi:dynein heavy chain 2, cytosolic